MAEQPTRDQLRALADAATPGPWETRGYKEMPGKYVVGPWKPDDLARGPVVLMEPLFCDERSAADAEFIVAAREAVPALLDALAAAEHRATQAEAQAEARRVSILYWQGQAGAMRGSAEAMARDAEKAQERALEAEERVQAVYAECGHAAGAAVMYRDTHYPEGGTP